MNYWSGQDVVLRLSPAGKRALFGIFDTEYIQVFVQWADEFGLWIVRDRPASGEITVMLVKWAHFDMASLDVLDSSSGRIAGFQ